MKLTDHFTLEELTITQTRIKNDPPAALIERLTRVALALEYVRASLGGVPIIVNSGYRCPAVNKAVGGSKTSAHMDGWAVDFIAPMYGSPLKICKLLAVDGAFHFDQLIEEGTWVHLSIDPARARREVLTMRNGKYVRGLKV